MSSAGILAIDQGTTGTTALIVRHDGSIAGRGYAPVEQHYPQPGWVEHDASQIWQTVLAASARAIETAGQPAIAAIGITNQRETTVVWDRASGAPLGPAIVWQCRRTAVRCRQLVAAGAGPMIQARSGLVLDAYFSGTKLEWLLQNVPLLSERARRGDALFGTIDSWLLWNLTGGALHATDVSNASRTLLLDIESGTWSKELLALFGVPEAMLPRVGSSSGVLGHTVRCGPIPAGLPLAGVAGDQQAALFGQGCFSNGSGKTTYGTGCFLLMNTGRQRVHSQHQMLSTVAWRLGSAAPLEYALEGSVFIGGAVVQWLRDELGLIQHASETDLVARSVPDSAGVFIVPAFTGLGAPYWDQDARGTITGLTRGTTRAHLVRASLEAIAHQVCDVVEAMQADYGSPLAEMRVDGGAAANDFLMQFQADLLDRPVVRPVMLETTAFGAAALAGLGSGFWSSPEEIATVQRTDHLFEPAMAASRRTQLRAGWRDAVARSRSTFAAT